LDSAKYEKKIFVDAHIRPRFEDARDLAQAASFAGYLARFYLTFHLIKSEYQIDGQQDYQIITFWRLQLTAKN
jgi:hypothetical protein